MTDRWTDRYPNPKFQKMRNCYFPIFATVQLDLMLKVVCAHTCKQLHKKKNMNKHSVKSTECNFRLGVYQPKAKQMKTGTHF